MVHQFAPPRFPPSVDFEPFAYYSPAEGFVLGLPESLAPTVSVSPGLFTSPLRMYWLLE